MLGCKLQRREESVYSRSTDSRRKSKSAHISQIVSISVYDDPQIIRLVVFLDFQVTEHFGTS